MMASIYMSHILNLLMMMILGQNKGQNFKNYSFLEKEAFERIWEMARYLC